MIGVSEKLDGGLEDFHPDRMAGRILDLGDLESLFEQAQRNMDQDTLKEGAKKNSKRRIFSGRFPETAETDPEIGLHVRHFKHDSGNGEI